MGEHELEKKTIEKNGNTFHAKFNLMFDCPLKLSRDGMHKSLESGLIS